MLQVNSGILAILTFVEFLNNMLNAIHSPRAEFKILRFALL